MIGIDRETQERLYILALSVDPANGDEFNRLSREALANGAVYMFTTDGKRRWYLKETQLYKSNEKGE